MFIVAPPQKTASRDQTRDRDKTPQKATVSRDIADAFPTPLWILNSASPPKGRLK